MPSALPRLSGHDAWRRPARKKTTASRGKSDRFFQRRLYVFLFPDSRNHFFIFIFDAPVKGQFAPLA